jgi:hypothetical protein
MMAHLGPKSRRLLIPVLVQRARPLSRFLVEIEHLATGMSTLQFSSPSSAQPITQHSVGFQSQAPSKLTKENTQDFPESELTSPVPATYGDLSSMEQELHSTNEAWRDETSINSIRQKLSEENGRRQQQFISRYLTTSRCPPSFSENSQSILYNFGLSFHYPGQDTDAASRAARDEGFHRGQDLRSKDDDADCASMSSSTSSAYLSAQEEIGDDKSPNSNFVAQA